MVGLLKSYFFLVIWPDMIDLGYLCVESGIILFLFRDIFSTIYFNFMLFSLYFIFTQRRFFQPKVEHWNFLQILPFFFCPFAYDWEKCYLWETF